MPALSGQKTVATAGSAVQLGNQAINAPLMVKALDTNTGIVVIGNDGNNNVTTSNGLRLSASESVIFEFVGNLAHLYLNAAVNGEGVAWLILSA